MNGEDDHRCLRCGRRTPGIAIAAPASYIGATALALDPMIERAPDPTYARAEAPEQPALFQSPSQKIIPFEQVQRQVASRLAAAGIQPPAASTEAPGPGVPPANRQQVTQRPAARRNMPSAGQGNFDFRPDNAQRERVLATGVAAQVYGDGRVAAPLQRLTAGLMDASMVFMGFGLFAGAARLATTLLGGNAIAVGKPLAVVFAMSMILISLFYGMLWAMARRETAGMNWTKLQLVTFDGSPLTGRDRAVRFVSAWLSYCSGGLGLLWALADEENLAFHDHISKTYPAEKFVTITASGLGARRR